MESSADKTTLCPSARPELADSVVFGLVGGKVTEPRVTYLKQPLPVTNELLAKANPVTPTEIFRTAAPCASKNCQHFDGQDCRLATRVAEKLPAVVKELPPCSIRRDCRWWQQAGKAACLRCPQIITDNYNPSLPIHEVALPEIVT
ncbi:nitrogen fixation protein [Nostocaceae cyanobacterium CENA357]|uniref:Nitrogen fixation protein n=1 Tax=Atlanticothrix silvestris CENA357 TaxID=1725252 RepID=A0A8J7HCD1_9CYAN|nr:nitrogen fixation protein [Atlanticothrix silvestris]MBH8553538.1 nitrogen fixation protein [Atlanticothrix silvestris CENA357]